MLHATQPENLSTIVCPNYDSRSLVRLRKARQHFYRCGACDTEFARSKKTPFYRVRRENYLRLYAAAVLLWEPWAPHSEWRIARASALGSPRKYRRYTENLTGNAVEYLICSIAKLELTS